MSHMLNMYREMAQASRAAPPAQNHKGILDSVAGAGGLAGADDFTAKDIALSAVAAIQQWAETDPSELDSGETMADRLQGLMIGIADMNKDGALTDDEHGVLEMALNTGWDYLVKMGASDEDAGALLNDWDSDAAERVRDLVAASLPEGDAAAAADMDAFVFGPGDQEPMLDAAYKKMVAFRGGKKVRINKRISGTVRLSPKQKVAIRKMQMKSHSAGARMARMKSMKARGKAGL